MSETQAVAIREADALPAWNPRQVVAQVQLVQQIMREVMVDGEHYGTIPGTQKPTLLQPGAQKLCMTFRLSPEYDVQQRDLDGGHREYRVSTILRSIQTGIVVGSGVGVCSTLETKYRYRQADRLCPACGKATIIRGKAEFGGGWLCFAKKGGCGAKYKDADPAITGQNIGRVENPDIADCYNTCLKIGKKRSYVDAVVQALAVSDLFNVDLEDIPPVHPTTTPPPPEPEPPATPQESDAPSPWEQRWPEIQALLADKGKSDSDVAKFCREKLSYKGNRADMPAETVAAVVRWLGAM